MGEVGPKVAASIVKFFEEPANREVVKRLRAAGIDPQHARQEAVSSRLAGQTFVFTGTLARRSREEAGEFVRHGGKVVSSVSRYRLRCRGRRSSIEVRQGQVAWRACLERGRIRCAAGGKLAPAQPAPDEGKPRGRAAKAAANSGRKSAKKSTRTLA